MCGMGLTRLEYQAERVRVVVQGVSEREIVQMVM
jgi:hypothetical protein